MFSYITQFILCLYVNTFLFTEHFIELIYGRLYFFRVNGSKVWWIWQVIFFYSNTLGILPNMLQLLFLDKRWQDVLEILPAGINVISAVNIQHIESLNEEVKDITGVEVKERIPDSVLCAADEVVNIDLTSDELITRLKEGKIYKSDKIQTALNNFFKADHILQLRELALKEVASQVERKVESEIPRQVVPRREKFLACISSNEKTARHVIRKTARLASYYNSKWFVLYVQTPSESQDKIALDKRRYLINNFKLATEM